MLVSSDSCSLSLTLRIWFRLNWVFSAVLVHTGHRIDVVTVDLQSADEHCLEHDSEISTSICYCSESCPLLSALLVANVSPALPLGKFLSPFTSQLQHQLCERSGLDFSQQASGSLPLCLQRSGCPSPQGCCPKGRFPQAVCSQFSCAFVGLA